MQENKRKSQRWKLVKSLNVYDTDANVLAGRIVDLSSEGMKLHSHNALKTENIYNFKIEYESDRGQTYFLLVQAECVWTNKDTNPNIHNMGFKILDPNETISHSILGIIDELKIQ